MHKRVTFKNTPLALALIVPQLLLVFVFFYWPTGEALYWAFTLERPFGGGSEWVGLYNFAMVFADPLYWSSVRISIAFALLSTIASLAIAMLLALFVDRQLPGHRVYKFTFFLPYALAAPAVGLAFRFIFSPEAGVFAAVNQVFPGLWNPALNGFDAFALIVMAQAWSMVGYNFIFFLAGLQSIPRTISEAGAMDGASVMRRMWDLQFPLVAPTLFFLIVINVTDSFVNSFGIVDITTEGGPARSTNLMVYKIFQDGFQGKDFSLAAAQSIVLMGLIVVMTVVQFRWIERRVHYS